MQCRKLEKGFTLIELLISSVIVIFLGLTGFKAVSMALSIREDIVNRHALLREFELATEILRRDFNSIQRYPLPKQEFGSLPNSVIVTHPDKEVLLSFYLSASPILRQPTRKVELICIDKAELNETQKAMNQEVITRKEDNRSDKVLIRREYVWNETHQKEVLDREVIDTVLLTNISEVNVDTTLPKASKHENILANDIAIMPTAITLTFTHHRYGTISIKHGFL